MAVNIQKGLAAAGLAPLHVWNRTASKAEPVQAEGAIVEPSLESLASKCSLIFAMTFDDAALESAFSAISTLSNKSNDGKNKILVTCSTVAPSLVQQLEHKTKSVSVLSAPVFGRPDAAAAKMLVAVLAGGSETEKNHVAKYLEYTTRKITRLGGPAHTANVLKLTGNFCILSVIEMLAQAQTLAEKNGVPREAVVDVVSALMPGPIVTGYSERIARDEFDVGFTVDGGLKDVGLMRDLASSSSVSLPFADIAHGHLERQKAENKDLDWASLAKIVRKDSHL
ncbi:6-phosphogluconate dehydrogenase C-terminal domain-like protein [Rhizoclosmatium globosum]|uniref:6-phosphogluconate dehydrogenase C-terminal domain-like protein n=1 Tax=Rhizoclosmatium globosum TaxID=329046 RepID=A0A1Y2B3X0_9FUNG|nr:6-phosphogluconate dehydrogenase C-terminal domain-like protein [Rhizoclosmatium globosum]ORY30087.1 6-phosphogluconate dehydrogenase C-terminal domain-like protein [Rhizoclosmatium globosum]|eukprot:ORY29426.1 6-phosphogluconate dehydrogenase C-terminal domain-like protein [Rhizoclosmatium globosum]